jgi:hypothetical protein
MFGHHGLFLTHDCFHIQIHQPIIDLCQDCQLQFFLLVFCRYHKSIQLLNYFDNHKYSFSQILR